jgi:sulfur transfer complex TusBCD TusB component (DsrH family)
MKIKAGTIIQRYNGKPVMIEQDVYLQENGQPFIVNGMPYMTIGREMTVGDIFSTILSSKKVDQFNVLKSDVLARRFYQSDLVEIDKSDYSRLVEIIDKNYQFVPFVLAYAKRALIEAKDVQDKPDRKHIS